LRVAINDAEGGVLPCGVSVSHRPAGVVAREFVAQREPAAPPRRQAHHSV